MSELTVFDGYCGAGGSSSGVEMVPGVRVRYAVNHWQMAIDTHNHNMPHVDHDRIDMTDEVDGDPRRYATTDLGWFSPECTTWSGARGEECDYDAASQQLDLLDDRPPPDEATARSRFQMETVPIFAEYHRYRAIIVENVTDILKWASLDAWLARFRAMGYRHRIVILNSAFAHQLGAPAPQLRDRVYFLFWQERYREPDLDRWTRPNAWCGQCDQQIRAVYVAKPGKRRPMRYGQQYDYRCPSGSCRGAVVHPYVLGAAAAINWSLPSVRIGDRREPLKPRTMARIAAGLARYYDPHSVPAACPPLLVPAGGTWNNDSTLVSDPMRTRTTRETEGLLVPGASRKAIPTATTARRQSPLERGHVVYAYDTGALRPLGMPLPTQTVVVGDALMGTSPRAEDCTFRMLDVDEIRAGMAFRSTFAMPFGAKRDRVCMLGNAVTPPAARDLMAAVVEAVTGTEVTAA